MRIEVFTLEEERRRRGAISAESDEFLWDDEEEDRVWEEGYRRWWDSVHAGGRDDGREFRGWFRRMNRSMDEAFGGMSR